MMLVPLTTVAVTVPRPHEYDTSMTRAHTVTDREDACCGAELEHVMAHEQQRQQETCEGTGNGPPRVEVGDVSHPAIVPTCRRVCVLPILPSKAI